MNLYTSDLHLGHQRCLTMDRRPFSDIDEMNEVLISRWNERVGSDDDIWVVGDLFFYKMKDPLRYLKDLNGHKHLVIGNHDGVILDDPEAAACFESIEHIAEFYDGKEHVVLFHYPMVEWPGSARGSRLIYGHIHNKRDESYEIMKTRFAVNAGCMINGYRPCSLEEMIANNRRFRDDDRETPEAAVTVIQLSDVR